MTQSVFGTALGAAAFITTACGILCLYLTVPRQLLLAAALPPFPARIAGAGLCLTGLILWNWLMPTATAIFIFLVVGMTVLMVLPFLASRNHRWQP